jgi:glucosamine--fructose-6-phosphate aminotransferase (isomerizing)
LGTNTDAIIEGQYLRDILDQPDALAATLAQLELPNELSEIGRRLRDGTIKCIVLTGMGASFYALHPLFLRLNGCGYSAFAVETSELIHSLECWLNPETLIVAVSQSGQSAEVVRLIEENQDRATLVGITNVAGSPLAMQAQASMLTMAGKEFSVSCKTYVTALMALRLLGDRLCGCDASHTREELAQAEAAVACYLRGWRDHVSEMRTALERVCHLFLLGRGASLAACGEGALIVKESVRLHAEGMSGAAFRHGPLEMVNGETFAVVFAGARGTRGLQAKLADDIRQAGGKTGWIAEDAGLGAWKLPETPLGLRPMLEILPVQMMTLALAAEAGIEAGRFARIPKITTVE